MKRASYAIEGWVARDGFYSEPLESRLQFFINEPHRSDSSRPYEQKWYALGFRCRLPEQCFPKLRWSHEPLKVRLELWKI